MIWTISSIIGLALSIQLPLGTINGRIIDRGDQAVSGIRVRLLQKLYSWDGIPELRLVDAATTNSQGEYQFNSVTPGNYYVRSDTFILGGDANSIDRIRGAYASTYYPAATNENAAVSLEVAGDSYLQNIDIIVTSAKLVTVRGRVTDAIRVRQPYICWAFLVSADANSTNGSRKVDCNADGTFEFRDVIPGSYYVIGRRIGGDTERADAVLPLLVQNADSDVELVSSPGSSIQGRVRGGGSPTPEVQLTLRPEVDPKSVSTRHVTSSPVGTFLVPTLAAGKYRVSFATPQGYYVKSAMLGRTDVLSDGLSIDGPLSSEMVISLSSGGRITGTVLDAEQRSLAGAVVVLVTAVQNRPDLYKVTLSDQNGQFGIDGVRPGDYRLYALSSTEWAASSNRGLTGPGQHVRVNEGDHLTTELHVSPR